jgi:hypothetical protein
VIYRRVKAKDRPTAVPSTGIQQKLYYREALVTTALTSAATSSGNVLLKYSTRLQNIAPQSGRFRFKQVRK